MSTNDKYHQFQTPERKAEQDSCVKESLMAGFKGGMWGFGVSSLIVGLSNHFSPIFRTSLNVSGKNGACGRAVSHVSLTLNESFLVTSLGLAFHILSTSESRWWLLVLRV
eukprot:jgi/Botrbrau1/9225/Bobra.0028s0021.1